MKKHDAGGEETLEWATGRSIRPQLFPLKDDDNDGVIRVTVPCSQTTDLAVKVVTPANEPIAGATVKLSPNGIFLMGGLFIPGWEWSMEDLVRGKNVLKTTEFKQWIQSSLLSPTTNEAGVARVNLPGEGRESFKIKAGNFVMPLHPLARSPEENRSIMVDLAPGKLLKRTVTMEREVLTRQRELLVVDDRGNPLADIELTALEFDVDSAKDEWHFWSVQRFGPVSKATTTAEGKAVLHLASSVENESVANYRVYLEGRFSRGAAASDDDRRKANVRDTVTIPMKDDGGVIAASVSKVAPDKRFAYWQATAKYVDPNTVSPASARESIQQMVEKPTLLLLKQLLAINDYEDSVPLSLDGEFNRLAPWNKKTPVADVDCGEDTRVVVLCKVRPRDATWTTKPAGRSPPGTAFVFDKSNGSLITAIGGGQSERGSYEHVSLTNLGGADDVFVSVNRFEKREVNSQGTRWYRLARAEFGPSLTVEHDGNSLTQWTATANPPTEFGYLGFSLKGKKVPDHALGQTRDGVEVLRKIYWDSAANAFLGPSQQYVDGKSIYRVILRRSEEFADFEPKENEIVVAGGRYDYQNWHSWELSVPTERKATLTLRIVTTNDDGKRSEEVLTTFPLKSGQRNFINFQVDPEKQTEETSLLRLRVNEKNAKADTKEFKVPLVPIDDSPSVPDEPVIRSGEESVYVWIGRSKQGDKETIVELVAQGESSEKPFIRNKFYLSLTKLVMNWIRNRLR